MARALTSVYTCTIPHRTLQISRLSMRSSTMSGIEDIYNVVNKIAALPPESTPQNEVEESAYDTLENVVKSIRTSDIAPSTFVPGLPGPGGVITSPMGTGKARDGTLMSPEPPQRQLAPTPPGLQSSTVSWPKISQLQFFYLFSVLYKSYHGHELFTDSLSLSPSLSPLVSSRSSNSSRNFLRSFRKKLRKRQIEDGNRRKRNDGERGKERRERLV